MTTAEKWHAAHAHRGLIRKVCQRFSLGNPLIAERMHDHAVDTIVRYHRRSPKEAAAIVKLTKWACLYILRCDRANGRAGAKHVPTVAALRAAAPNVPACTPQLRAACDAIEALAPRDRTLFREVFEFGRTWTDAVRATGLAETGMQGHRRRFLTRIQNTVTQQLAAA